MYGSALFIGFANASVVQPVVERERTVFYRERASGMYSSMPYAIAQVQLLFMCTVTNNLVNKQINNKLVSDQNEH